MGLVQLPNELLYLIASHLGVRELSNLSCCCHDLHTILTPTLYRRVCNDTGVIEWVIKDNSSAIRRLLDHGMNPDLDLTNFPTQARQLSQDFDGSLFALQDYQMQLMLLEQQNYRRRQVETSTFSRLRTPLHLAAKFGYNDIVRLLLDRGANISSLSSRFCSCVNIFTPHPDTFPDPGLPWWMPLHTAICYNEYDTTKLLITRGAPFQVAARAIGSSSNYVTALHTSCYMGYLDISRLVLDRYRPPIDIKDHYGMSPLSWAYRNRQWDTIDWLVENGADIDADAGDGRSLLLDACLSGQIQAACRLLGLGANPRFSLDATPLYHCCCTQASKSTRPEEILELVKCLVSAGADVNAKKDANDDTPLAAAAARGSFLVVKYLLQAGAAVDARDTDNMTPLMMACMPRGDKEGSLLQTVELLLQWGASAKTTNSRGQTALEILCFDGKTDINKGEVVRLLLEHGSPPNASDPTTSLIPMLFKSKDLEICAYLQRYGTRLPTEADLKLMINQAIKWNDAKALEYVLQFDGATKLLCTKTRLFKAIETYKHKVAKIILAAGAPWAYVSKSGWTCLHHSCKNSMMEMTHDLLGKGANPNCFTNRNETPLDFAIDRNDSNVVEDLLDHGADPFPVSIDQSTQEPHIGAPLRTIRSGSILITRCLMNRGLWNVMPPIEQSQSMYFVCDTGTERRLHLRMLLEVLLRGGADPNMHLQRPGGDHCVPLQIAMEHQHQEAVDLLLRYGATPL
ncbi:ankyrin [Hypomontagnella monticulosa]|nr:ankyrin [Hypomontagnella monticulosa]